MNTYEYEQEIIQIKSLKALNKTRNHLINAIKANNEELESYIILNNKKCHTFSKLTQEAMNEVIEEHKEFSRELEKLMTKYLFQGSERFYS